MATTTIESNLERELECFICMKLLYQPLTLIDCLHTNCGACLKEWFSHQRKTAIQARVHPSTNPYSCPACRATVKDARPNAMINTWLHLLTVQDPAKDRSQEDKDEFSEFYTPGEDILPTLESRRRRGERRPRETQHEVRERQMTEEARGQISQDTQAQLLQTQASLQLPEEPRSRNASRSRERARQERRERRREQARQERDSTQRAEQDATQLPYEAPEQIQPESSSANLNPDSPRHPAAVEARRRHQTVAHQASLVSLISSSDGGTGSFSNSSLTEEQIEAQIMQQIQAQGLLEGIDVDNLTEAEQDVLAERIADAFRQSRRARQDAGNTTPLSPTSGDTGNATTSTESHGERQSSSRQRRAETLQNAFQQEPTEIRPRAARTQPMVNEESLLSPQPAVAYRRRSSNQSQNSALVNSTVHQSSPSTHSDTRTSAVELSAASSTDAIAVAELGATEQSDQRSRPLRQAQPSTTNQPLEFDEPSIMCYRCHRADIQYEVYKHCFRCDLNLCTLCYRSRRGCRHWYGFGHEAMAKFEAETADRRDTEHVELPHILVGRSTIKPELSLVTRKKLTKDGKDIVPLTTRSDPKTRAREGYFCDRCGAFANSQFWSCSQCNDGEWGFCKNCVDTHHCCTHPLLPVALQPDLAEPQKHQESHVEATSANLSLDTNLPRPVVSQSSSVSSAVSAATGQPPGFYSIPIPISVSCDVCQRQIPRTESRFHCPSHSTPSTTDTKRIGDYDICISCYHNLVKTNRINREDGPAGWRKCPNDHRMIITAFEPDNQSGHRRVVLNDLVGGWGMDEQDVRAFTTTFIHRRDQTSDPLQFNPQDTSLTSRGVWRWREEQNTSRRSTRPRTITLSPSTSSYTSPTSPTTTTSPRSKFPPDGGFGSRASVMRSYYPDSGEDGKGELSCPRGAELRVTQDINGDWCEVVYAGDIGLVPSGYLWIYE